jgi:UDP-galactopyranose mutase
MQKCVAKFAEEKQFSRFYSHLGETSKALLASLLEQVEKFVEETKTSTKNEQLVLQVKSRALRKQLQREVSARYKELGNIYCEFKSNLDTFTVKKWWKRNNHPPPQVIRVPIGTTL